MNVLPWPSSLSTVDSSAVNVLDDVFGQRQSQARARGHVLVLLHAIELLEDALAVLLAQAHARVLDLEADLVVDQAAAERHLAAGVRVLDGVATAG